MPEVKENKRKKAEDKRKAALREPFIEKLKSSMPPMFRGNKGAEAKAGKPAEGARSFLTQSLKERRGR